MESLYNSLSERLWRNHEVWLACGGDPDGVLLSGGEESLPVLEYPPQEVFPVISSTDVETLQETRSRELHLSNMVGGDPVPVYPKPPEFVDPPPYS